MIRPSFARFLSAAFAIAAHALGATSSAAAEWSPHFITRGPSGSVEALRASGGFLYAAGFYDSFGRYAHPGVMRWDGTAWSPVGPGLMGYVSGMAITASGTICVSGEFWSPASERPHYALALWDGAAWKFAPGSANRSGVGPIAAVGDTVYLQLSGREVPEEIGRWDGAVWSTLPFWNGERISALEAYGSDLIVGGRFNGIGGLADTNLAAYSGGRWKSLGRSIPFGVRTLAVIGGELWVGGDSIQGSGSVPTRLALMRWNGQAWSELAVSMGAGNDPVGSAWVYALAGEPGHVYASGGFAHNRSGLAEWDGVRWRAYRVDSTSHPITLAAFGGDLWAGRNSRYHTGSWLERFHAGLRVDPAPDIVSRAPEGFAQILASDGKRLLAFGAFGSALADSFRLAAEWNGSGWTHLGPSFPNPGHEYVRFYSTALRGDSVFAAAEVGPGTSGVPGHRVLRAGGSMAWDTLGGFDGRVNAICLTPEGLYAGGAFTRADGAPIARLALREGGGWRAAGGPDRPVTALAWDGTALFAADMDTSAYPRPARVWRRQDGAWSRLGPDTGTVFDGEVLQLIPIGGRLWAAGTFRHAGNDPVRGVAAWDGSAWKPVGQELDSSVTGLAVGPQGEVYATGLFTVPSPSAARWNGSAWEAMGTGLTRDAYSRPTWMVPAWFDEGLFVAGDFRFAGGKPSPGIARWSMRPEGSAVAARRRPAKAVKGGWTLYPDGGVRIPYPGRAGLASDAAGRATGTRSPARRIRR